MLALTRAARSFTLYDPANKVVRQLIGEYREKMRRVLDGFGSLLVDVHPFELLLGKDVIYRERDRERSLAFRLFRDGVRRLTFSPKATWEEQLRLLEIFSVRYSAVRQQEDDLVTLLRKAAFEGITVVALEGFVPDEELAESAAAQLQVRSQKRFDPPRQWDLPLPPFPDMGGLHRRDVGEELLRPLRDEEAPESVPTSAVRAVHQLLACASTSEIDSVLGFAAEVRDFLVVEARADCLGVLVELVRSALPAEKQAGFLQGFLSPKAIRALIAGQPDDADEIPPELAELLDLVPGDILEVLLDLMAEAGDGPRARLLHRLVARAAIGAPDQLLSRAREADPAIAGALLGVLHEVDPKKAVRAELELAPRAEPSLQLVILGRLEAVHFDLEVARTLKELTHAPSEAVRIRALEILAAKGGARSFPSLQAHAERRPGDWSAAEAESAGRALAKSSPQQALQVFGAWLHPKRAGAGLLGRLIGMTTAHPLQQAALAGLSQIEAPEAHALLDHLAKHGAEDLRRPAEAAIASRKPGGHPRG